MNKDKCKLRGRKFVDGKCINAKVNYNPFKMWGSLIGASFYIITFIFTIMIKSCYSAFLETCSFSRWILFPIIKPEIIVDNQFITLIALIMGLIFWTLIGLGIHSLIRSFKK